MTCSSKQLCSTHTCSQSEPNVWLNYMNDERALIVVSYVTMTNCNDRLCHNLYDPSPLYTILFKAYRFKLQQWTCTWFALVFKTNNMLIYLIFMHGQVV